MSKVPRKPFVYPTRVVDGSGDVVSLDALGEVGPGTAAAAQRVTFASDAPAIDVNSAAGEQDDDNTTTTPLTSGATYTGTWSTSTLPDVMVSCQTDNTGKLYFDFSNDGGANVNTFPTNGFDVASGIHEFHTALKGPRSFRVRLVNDAGDQTYLRLYTFRGSFAKQPNAPLNQDISDDSDATITRSVLAGEEAGNGKYNNILSTAEGELLTSTFAASARSLVAYEDAAVSSNQYILMVDLDNSGGEWPHSETATALDVDHTDVSVVFFSGTAEAVVRLGVVTRIDEFDSDITWLISRRVGRQSSNNSASISSNYQPSSVRFEAEDGAAVGALSSVQTFNEVAVNTGSAIASPAGTTVAAVGDIIMMLEYVSDTYSVDVDIVYHATE